MDDMDDTVTRSAKRQQPKGGSRKGIPNKATAAFRDTITRILADNSENMGRWLTLVAEGDGTDKNPPDPGKALDLVAKLAEFSAPKLNRTEHTGENGGAIRTVSRIELVPLVG